MPRKIYVIDTNVIMYAGKKALTSFEEHEVVIPFTVVEELEKKRTGDGLGGAMARHALREIDSLRTLGKLKDGITINSEGGTLRIEMNHRDPKTLPDAIKDNWSNDVRILTVANNLYLEEVGYQKDFIAGTRGEPGREVILVSNDLPLRIKADSLFDMKIEPFRLSGNRYPGLKNVNVADEVIANIYESKEADHSIEAPAELVAQTGGAANHAFSLSPWGSVDTNGKSSTLVTLNNGRLAPAALNLSPLKAVKAKSQEQAIALNYLNDPDMEIVSLGGKAGTGKSLLSIVSGISQVSGTNPLYRKIVVIRPLFAVGGQDIGFLPGDADDKMEPWKKAIYDSVEGLVDPATMEHLTKENMIDVMPATFLRGRTFHNTYVVVDEAQNFEASVLLTILSRIGAGSKIVFLWDATQKDNTRLGYGDGIVSVVDKLRKESMFAHISLVRSERSRVAEIAGTILEDYME